MFYPTAQSPRISRQTVSAFGALNRCERAAANEFAAMENLTGDSYPVLSTRGRRSAAAHLSDPLALAAKGSLAYIDGGKFYYAGQEIAGITLSTIPAMREKQIVGMGAYLVIFPDKLYFNTEDPADFGHLEHTFTHDCSASPLQLRLCRRDGTPYEAVTASAEPPAEPADGALWLDTRADSHSLSRYSVTTLSWVSVPSTYVRLEAPQIELGFSEGDGITLGGMTAGLDGANVIESLGSGYVVVTGLIDTSLTQSEGTVTLARRVPDMDYVTECGNRLWGCKYGIVDGKTVNEIYACALGDFRNWNRFQGLSTDSYCASRGSDGCFTGAVTYLGNPLFFKENCIEKVYPSDSGAHQIAVTNCSGVKRGCARSLAVAGGRLYYLGANAVYAYDGSLPVSVSDALGVFDGADAAGGALGGKYYLSAREGEAWSLYVYDTRAHLWHREDATHALCFASLGAELFFLTSAGELTAVRGSTGTPEAAFSWYCESARIGAEQPDNKYVTRVQLRFRLGEGDTLTVFVRYDGGAWEDKGTVRGTTLQPRSVTVPILPRRCDHFALKLAGTGAFRLYSLTRLLESGSDVFRA